MDDESLEYLQMKIRAAEKLKDAMKRTEDALEIVNQSTLPDDGTSPELHIEVFIGGKIQRLKIFRYVTRLALAEVLTGQLGILQTEYEEL